MKKLEQLQEQVLQVPLITEGLLAEGAGDALLKDIELFKNSVNEAREIKIPFVGIFNAGKSSMLNALMGRDILPVDNEPMTTICAELRGDKNERIELYREGSLIGEYAIDRLGVIDTEPGDVAHVFVDNEFISSLTERGIVLVDMPGIDSGIEQHNKAIANYLCNGTLFVMLLSANAGSLPRSSGYFMRELRAYGLNPPVILTKSELFPAENNEKVCKQVKNDLELLGFENPIVKIASARTDCSALADYLNQINADELAITRVRNIAKSIVNSATSYINDSIRLQKLGLDNATAQVNDLKEKVAELLANAKKGNETETRQTPAESTQDIMLAINTLLANHSNELTILIKARESVDTIQTWLLSLVRPELSRLISKENEQYINALDEELSIILGNLVDAIVIKDWVSDFVSVSAQYIDQLPEDYQELAREILELLPAIISIVEDVVNWFRQVFGGQNQDDLIKDRIERELIQPFLAQLEPKVLAVVTDNQKKIDDYVQSMVTSRLNQAQKTLEDMQAQAEQDVSERETSLALLDTALGKLTILAEKIKNECYTEN